MIATENLQIWLPFQNSIQDYGKAGLAWFVQGGRAQDYEKGVFGNSYKFNDPTNHIKTSLSTNPCNISNEFTVVAIAQFQGSSGGSLAQSFCSIGILFAGNGGGLGCLTSGVGALQCTIMHGGNTATQYGTTYGRWETNLNPILGKTYFIAFSRSSNGAYCRAYNYTDNIDFEQELSASLPNMNTWLNRRVTVGALYHLSGANDESFPSVDGNTNSVMVWNKALSKSDIDRLRHNLHPLNG